MRELSPAQIAWIDRARDADILAVAQRAPISAKLKKHAREYVGACPVCGGKDRFAVNPTKKGGVFFCRGFGGGDVIAMVEHVCSVTFLPACEIINGRPMPEAEAQISAEDLARAAKQRELDRIAREHAQRRQNKIDRERERRAAYDMWRGGAWSFGSPVETYLRRARGIDPLPERLPLRYASSVAFFQGEEINQAGRKVPRVIWRGPVMLAPIVDTNGKFRGVHRTWLDLEQPGGKAVIVDPTDGEVLNPKKCRGSVDGNVIRLIDVPMPRRLFVGEGIETVLSVWVALHRAGRDLSDAAFWCSVSLGNLGGPALGTVPHPVLRDDKGRPRNVLGPEPDLDAPTIHIPDSVVDVVLLGDGDSDRFATQCAHARANKRHTRIGRVVRTAWAPEGKDFNDLVRAA
jgi:hypothetical protein